MLEYRHTHSHTHSLGESQDARHGKSLVYLSPTQGAATAPEGNLSHTSRYQRLVCCAFAKNFADLARTGLAQPTPPSPTLTWPCGITRPGRPVAAGIVVRRLGLDGNDSRFRGQDKTLVIVTGF